MRPLHLFAHDLFNYVYDLIKETIIGLIADEK